MEIGLKLLLYGFRVSKALWILLRNTLLSNHPPPLKKLITPHNMGYVVLRLLVLSNILLILPSFVRNTEVS